MPDVDDVVERLEELITSIPPLLYDRDRVAVSRSDLRTMLRAYRAALQSSQPREGWLTVEAERVLYVDRGKETILCDRLPSPVTLVIKVATQPIEQENVNG